MKQCGLVEAIAKGLLIGFVPFVLIACGGGSDAPVQETTITEEVIEEKIEDNIDEEATSEEASQPETIDNNAVCIEHCVASYELSSEEEINLIEEIAKLDPLNSSENSPVDSNILESSTGSNPENNSENNTDNQSADDSIIKQALTCHGQCYFPGSIVLGRPTDNTIAINISSEVNGNISINYDLTANTLSSNSSEGSAAQQSSTTPIIADEPLTIELTNLEANRAYQYQVNFQQAGSEELIRYPAKSFHTQRSANQEFSFAIHADPHLGIRVRGAYEEEKADEGHYAKTMSNTLASNVDFMIDLGDTFMSEKNASRDFYDATDDDDKTDPLRIWVEEDYQRVRAYFAQITDSVPLYLVNGNHEGESGWHKDDPDSIAVWANNLRKQYFPVASANDFYAASAEVEDYVGTHNGYYSWQWGDAQFIVLDPFWYGSEKAKIDTEWQWTLGKEQYDWLQSTLSTSDAKYKFVFLHNLVGGQNDSTGLGRGGALVASDWEWGGHDPATGEYEFDLERPGWGKPIHNILVEHGVNVVFHGHDHVFVKEVHVDGIIYQTVPQPSVLNDTDTKAVKRAAESGYDVLNGNISHGAGFIKVNVANNITQVEYIRTVENELSAQDCQLATCGEVAYQYQFTSNNVIADSNANEIKSGRALVAPEDLGYKNNTSTDANTDESAGMHLSSPAFKYTGSDYYNLPLHFTCEGISGGVSPSLSWQGIPLDATHLTLAMHSVKQDGSKQAHFTLFNISAAYSKLDQNDFSIGTAALGDNAGSSYFAPCVETADESGDIKYYTFTLYAHEQAISVDESANQQAVIEALSDVIIQSSSLTTQRVHFHESAIAADQHVPTKAVTTCEEKSAHFENYSAVHKSITCDNSNNQFTVISHISDGLKTLEPEQQVQVGINSWIGRLPLVSQAGTEIAITPTFLNTVSNNVECDGTEPLGVTVDGQLILPYFKQNNSTGTGANCGEADGKDYANLDTVVLGEVDQCFGHSPNGEGYHLHGAPICLMDVHDPSKPIAYMTDGIPLYFGEAGGTIEGTDHASRAKAVTTTNYGAGLYQHLDYRPSDVKDGTNPLNECNAYDINNDGATSGYVYYSSKDAPYSIGCFMAQPLTNKNKASVTRTQLVSERNGWTGQTVGEAIDVSIISSDYQEWQGKTYNITEMLVNETSSFLTKGDIAQVLWRVLDDTDNNYDSSKTCFEFRYRANKNVSSNDETEIVCTKNTVPSETLDFTPFGDDSRGQSVQKQSFKLEAWADNWFAAYLEDALIVEDSVAITTERSFNSEVATFEASYPMYLNFIIKDFKENDTGLEYIGQSKQQMGDGGFIAQITELTTGEVAAVTNEHWQCTSLHQAPLDKSCEDESSPEAGVGTCQFTSLDPPLNWLHANFDDSGWVDTTEYSVEQVSPKEGYEEISWHEDAKLIWGNDLEIDNTLLCRVTVTAP